MEEDTKFNEIAQSALDAPFRAQQKRTELAQLLKFLSKQHIFNVLEIGVYKGGTIKAWTQILPYEARIVGVDLPSGPYGGGFNDQEAKWIEGLAQGEQTIKLFALDSHDEKTLETISEFGPFDFLFIDGDHTYEGVRKDFEMYSHLVRDGGYIAFHDVAEHTNYHDVKVHVFWQELQDKNPTAAFWSFIDLAYPTDHGIWGGIGLVQKNGQIHL